MNESRPKSRLAPALVFAVVVSAVLAVYVAGYFACMREGSFAEGGDRYRYFGSMRLCAFFSPAARVEAVVTGDFVCLCCLEGTYDMYPNHEDWLQVYFHKNVIRENAEKDGWWFPW